MVQIEFGCDKLTAVVPFAGPEYPQKKRDGLKSMPSPTNKVIVSLAAVIRAFQPPRRDRGMAAALSISPGLSRFASAASAVIARTRFVWPGTLAGWCARLDPVLTR